jgi:Asp-tRNA(Asn)/Glu-tRNA(Gln) amidotransferase C subunit
MNKNTELTNERLESCIDGINYIKNDINSIENMVTITTSGSDRSKIINKIHKILESVVQLQNVLTSINKENPNEQ